MWAPDHVKAWNAHSHRCAQRYLDVWENTTLGAKWVLIESCATNNLKFNL